MVRGPIRLSTIEWICLAGAKGCIPLILRVNYDDARAFGHMFPFFSCFDVLLLRYPEWKVHQITIILKVISRCIVLVLNEISVKLL